MSQNEISQILQEMRTEVQKMVSGGVNPSQDIKDELNSIVTGLKDLKNTGAIGGASGIDQVEVAKIITELRNEVNGIGARDSSVKSELVDICTQLKAEVHKIQTELKSSSQPVVQKESSSSEDVQKLSAKVKELENAEVTLKKSHQEQVDKITRDLSGQINTLKTEASKAPVVDNSAELTKLKKDLEAKDALTKELQNTQREITTDMASYKEGKEMAEKSLAVEIKKVVDLQKEIETLKSQNQTLTKQLSEEEKKSSDLKTKLSAEEEKNKKLSEKKVEVAPVTKPIVQPTTTPQVTKPVVTNTPPVTKSTPPVEKSSPSTVRSVVTEQKKPDVVSSPIPKTGGSGGEPKLSKIQERTAMLQKSRESPPPKSNDPVDIYKK